MRKIIFIISILTSAAIFAQVEKDSLGVEQVNVVKPYTPSISDAFKVKENPSLKRKDSVVKQKVNYTIYSVPVASTFTPAKGKAKGLKRAPKEHIYENYLSVGFGNYITPVVEGFVHNKPDRTTDYGIFFKHHSSQGGIKNLLLDDSFSNSDIDFFYKKHERKYQWQADIGIKHQAINWYGLPQSIPFLPAVLNNIDERQSYFGINLGGNLTFEKGIFKGGKVALNNFSDKRNSNEIHVLINPKVAFPIASELINADATIEFLDGSFKKGYNLAPRNKHSFVNFGFHPNLEILRNDLTVRLGTKLYYAFDLQNKASKLFAYPNVTASYRVVDEIFTVFAGVTGDLHQNSYRQFVAENPYVSPTLNVQQSDEQYNAFLGAKGKIIANVGYNFKAAYSHTKNSPLFIQNQTLTDGTLLTSNAYEAGNSFEVIYDDITTLAFTAGLDIDFSKELKFGGDITLADYTTTNTTLLNAEAWNLPTLKAGLFSNYKGQKWFGGAKLFFESNRKDLVVPYATIANASHINTNASYIDLNANIGYQFTAQLSVFAKANNIFSVNYQPYTNYKTQGFQILGGLTYKFDF